VSFEAPLLLLGLAIVPLAVVAYWLLQRRPSAYAVRFSNLEVLAEVVGGRATWRRHVPAVLLLTAIGALLVALARPTWTVAAPNERATVVLVIDVSGSMRATDVAPSRLAAAKTAMRGFLDKAPEKLRVGIVSFSDDAQVVVPPTVDRDQLEQGIALLGPGFGTALGDAIARAVDLAQTATSEVGEPARTTLRDDAGRALASVLLLSDGAQTRGVLSPGQAAQQAIDSGVPVYTVALGTDAGTILVGPRDQRQLVPVPPDRETLAAVAEATGAETFDAESADALRKVYEGLGSKVGRVDQEREITAAFVAAGALLLTVAVGAATLSAPRLP